MCYIVRMFGVLNRQVSGMLCSVSVKFASGTT